MSDIPSRTRIPHPCALTASKHEGPRSLLHGDIHVTRAPLLVVESSAGQSSSAVAVTTSQDRTSRDAFFIENPPPDSNETVVCFGPLCTSGSPCAARIFHKCLFNTVSRSSAVSHDAGSRIRAARSLRAGLNGAVHLLSASCRRTLPQRLPQTPHLGSTACTRSRLNARTSGI